MENSYSNLDKKVASEDSKKDILIAELQEELTEQRNQKKEERFCWSLVLTIMLDVYFFSHLDGWGAPISILILEVILLFILARKLGVEDLTNILDKYLLNGPLNKRNGDHT